MLGVGCYGEGVRGRVLGVGCDLGEGSELGSRILRTEHRHLGVGGGGGEVGARGEGKSAGEGGG